MVNHFVLSLESSSDRRIHIINEFKKIDALPHFFNAIDGRLLSEKEKKEICCNPALAPGEIGCAASHLEMYKKFLSSKEKAICIFEDDIIISPQVTQNILDDAFHFIEISETPSVLLLSPRRRMGAKVGFAGPIPIYKCFRGTCTHAYILNRQAAQAIITANTPIQFEADPWDIYEQAEILSLYALGENLFRQAPEKDVKSIIGSKYGRADYSKIHKKLRSQFLKEHDFTMKKQIKAWVFPHYYALCRRFLNK